MKKLSPAVIILLTAAFLTLTANYTFFSEVSKVYPMAAGNFLFLISVGVLLFSLLTLSMSLLSMVFPVRMVISLFLLVAAISSYYADQFGTIIDTQMLENVAQTDVAEARDLLTVPFISRIAFLGIAAIAVVWRLPFQQRRWLSRLLQTTGLATASLAVIAITIISFSDQYAGFFREHKTLRFYTNPLMPIYSALQYTAAMASTPENTELVKIGEDAHIDAEDREHHELVIVVVGETARWDRFSLNGYKRQTNPELEKESRLISYSNIASCGTSTAISVPCMFSKTGRDNFDIDEAKHQENALDILQRAGVSVLWRDNNSSSKGVADRVRYEDFRKPETNPVCDTECRDIGMLNGLQSYIDSQPGDVLIVLHQMGNHGPAYFKRYPAEFERFTPVCKSLNFADCTSEEINNAYDNAILYTDYFLSQVIQLLKNNTPNYETAMLYVSDHGESLGEHGLYLHGAPYMIAPHEQTGVPVMLWVGESSDIDFTHSLDDKTKPSSHDAVFHSLLAAFEVKTIDLDRHNMLFELAPESAQHKLAAVTTTAAGI